MGSFCQLPHGERIAQIRELGADAVSRDGLEHKAAGSGAPSDETVLGLFSEIHHIGAGVYVEQCAAEVETALAAELDVEEGEVDLV